MNDYYSILGIKRSASSQQVKQAYRTMAKKFHPDIHAGNKEFEAKFKEIVESYETLKDPKKRFKYDLVSFFPEPIGKQPHLKGQFEWAYNYFSSYMNDFMSKQFASLNLKIRKRRGKNIYKTVPIELEKLYLAESCKFTFTAPRACPSCKGEGFVENPQSEFERTWCHKCDGTSLISKKQTISFSIPKGADNHHRISLTGEGGQGPYLGPNGDLILRLQIIHNQRYRKHKDDLVTSIQLSPSEAILGTMRDVPLFNSSVSMKIPPEVQHGHAFRLKGLGFFSAEGKRGDLLVEVEIKIPTQLSAQAKNAVEALKQHHPGL